MDRQERKILIVHFKILAVVYKKMFEVHICIVNFQEKQFWQLLQNVKNLCVGLTSSRS